MLATLYQQPYRILHISAHGVFDLRHQDGRLRSGVVLSDGLLITAAEIEAMEIGARTGVPELLPPRHRWTHPPGATATSSPPACRAS